MNAGRPAPRLETERLILRETRAEDVEACAGLWGGERVVRHIGGKPSTPSEAWARMLRFPPASGRCLAMGTGRWRTRRLAPFAARSGLRTSSAI